MGVMKASKFKYVLWALVLGVLLVMITGLIPNDPGLGIPEIRRYGYPLFWLVTNLNGPTSYIMTNLIVDILFWAATSFIIILFVELAMTKIGASMQYGRLLSHLGLFVILGLLVDLVHELGHGFLGTIAGGRFAYLQIAYFILYPSLAVTSDFRLGVALIEGLPYGSFAYGLMLLGGSMMTNVASWTIAIIQHFKRFKGRTRFALKVVGFLGMLDLPLYIILPQMGLSHWLIMGGREPEPLQGARMIGIPDYAFLFLAALSTSCLFYLHFKQICIKTPKK